MTTPVALVVDDGPNPETASLLLEVDRRVHTAATFRTDAISSQTVQMTDPIVERHRHLIETAVSESAWWETVLTVAMATVGAGDGHLFVLVARLEWSPTADAGTTDTKRLDTRIIGERSGEEGSDHLLTGMFERVAILDLCNEMAGQLLEVIVEVCRITHLDRSTQL